jgi:signal peptidase
VRILALVALYAVIAVVLLASAGTLGLRLAGLEPLVVRTSSMEPTIMAGDLILARTIDAPLEIGGIYIHRSPETGGDTAHRLVATGPQEGTWYTQGDNNEVPDGYVLSTSDFSREVVAWLPRLGFVSVWIGQPWVKVLMFLAPMALFLPSLLRRRRSPEPGVAAEDADDDADASRPHLTLSRTDMVVSALIAIAIFTVLAARLILNLTPVVVPPSPSGVVSGGAMALVQPGPVSDLAPGDVIWITMPQQAVPTLRLVTPADPTAAVAVPDEGSTYLFTTDATAPGEVEAAQFEAHLAVTRVVGEIPQLGRWLPILATPAGFAGVLALLGLFATMLMLRLSLAAPRSAGKP